MVRPVPVVLQPHEVRNAVLVGVGRNLEAKRQQRQALIPGSNTFLGDIVGALGEVVVAKALGVYWCPDIGGNDHQRGDVAGLQVRSTTRWPVQLVIRDRDDDDDVFVLVTGQPPCLTIAGWMRAADARRPEWQAPADHPGPPAHLVPATALVQWNGAP
jgi:hypothetical protein